MRLPADGRGTETSLGSPPPRTASPRRPVHTPPPGRLWLSVSPRRRVWSLSPWGHFGLHSLGAEGTVETSSHSAVTPALCPDRQSPGARLHKPEVWLSLRGSPLDPMLVAFSPAQPSLPGTTPHGKDCPWVGGLHPLYVGCSDFWGPAVGFLHCGRSWHAPGCGEGHGGCHGGVTEGPSLHTAVARAGRGGRALGRRRQGTSCSGFG